MARQKPPRPQKLKTSKMEDLEPVYTADDAAQDGVEDDAANERQARKKYDISFYGADYTVDALVQRLTSGAFFVPPFQRSYVWTYRQASRFIETLLLGLPVPGIFLSKDEKSSKHLVIDGQQRLKTLQYFYSGIFGAGTDKPFKLVDVVEPWDGLTVSDLSEDDKQRLDDTVIHTTIFKQSSPKDGSSSIFHVFERINTGGVKLQPQEIRTCIYFGRLTDFLKGLNDVPAWRSIFGPKSPRLKDQELILRFLALYDRGDKYQRPMVDFLNAFAADFAKMSASREKALGEVFRSTVAVAQSALEQPAFRPQRGLNAAVFDAVMVGLARRIKRGQIRRPSKLRDRYTQLIGQEKFLQAYRGSTADEENVSTRLELATEAFADVP